MQQCTIALPVDTTLDKEFKNNSTMKPVNNNAPVFNTKTILINAKPEMANNSK
jgi:hypothetical protein